MPEYFVVFGDRKKVLKGDGREELFSLIRRKFEIEDKQKIIIQQYNETYQDFIDVDSEDEFPQGGKINILVKETDVNSAALEQSPTMPTRETEQGDLELLIHTENVPTNGAGARTITPGEQLNRWPCRFQLPKEKFGKRLATALANKDNLGPTLTTALMDVLYAEITNVTFFPTPAQYSDVIESLMTSFPHLRQLRIGDLTLDGDSAFRKWKNILSDKFRNMRKRRDRAIPEVAARKRAIPQPGESGAAMPKAGKPNQWGLKHFLPERLSTEDDTSILKAKQWMNSESVKRRPDMPAVKLRMDLTFADRRKEIVQNHIAVVELKTNYPCLFMEEEILNEFRRLSEIDVDKSFLSGLKKYGQAILKITPDSNEQKKKIVDSLAASKIEADRNRLTAYGCLLVLPALLKERLCEIVCEIESKPVAVSTPLLVFEGDMLGTADFKVIVEDCVVAQPLDLIQGFECLLACYYIFNIAYCSKSVNTLTFIQKCLLNLSDNATTPRKVVSLMCKLSQ